jgi:hypothetical protein
MGRPLNKKYFGNRNIGSSSVTTDNGIGGEGIASITLGGTNNSTGWTNNSTTQATVSAPDLPSGVTAVLKIHTFAAAGALTNKTTYNTFTGTSVTAAATYTGVSQKAVGGTSGSGTGAVFTIAKTGSGTSYTGVTTITLTSAGSGYALDDTITISGADLGGVVTTNDFTFTIKTFVGTTGTIESVEVTEKGSGYTSAPTVTWSGGTKGTLTLTSALTTDSGSAGSSTNQENAIVVTAFIPVANGGTSALTGDIVKQTNDRRYKVKTAEGTGICQLVTDGVANAAGEMSIKATDSEGKNYLVAKLTSRKVVLVPAALGGSSGTQFASGTSAKWTFGDAVLNTTVKIENA